MRYFESYGLCGMKKITLGLFAMFFIVGATLLNKTTLFDKTSLIGDFTNILDVAIKRIPSGSSKGEEQKDDIRGSKSIYEWEEQLRAAPSLADTSTASSNLKSSVTVLNPKPSYVVGESLRLRVDIRDDAGRQMDHGGDGIRVTLDDVRQGAHLATHVDDLKNGSYLAVLPLLWAGNPSVSVNIAVQFATYRAFYYIRSVLKSIKLQRGVFKKGTASEETVCSPYEDNPSYNNKSVCDFTQRNGGLGWYCVRPKVKDLKCDDWSTITDSEFLTDQLLTSAERDLGSESAYSKAHGQHGQRFIPNNITLKVGVGNFSFGKPDKDMIRRSWTDKAPRGYFVNKKWYPKNVKAGPLKQEELFSLLKNTTIYLLGDSNLRLMFGIIADRMGCKINTGVVKPAWHHPLHCVDDASGFKMHWRVHALPFHGGQAGADIGDSRAAHLTINDIPDDGRFIVCVHFYVHFTFHSMDLIKEHLQATRNSIERALKRNSNIQFVIRGPHMHFLMAWGAPAYTGGDLSEPWFTSLTKEVFRGLESQVVFLQPWDMTVAMQNPKTHPPDYVNWAIVDLMFAYLK